jgi:hypothetical protein
VARLAHAQKAQCIADSQITTNIPASGAISKSKLVRKQRNSAVERQPKETDPEYSMTA